MYLPPQLWTLYGCMAASLRRLLHLPRQNTGIGSKSQADEDLSRVSAPKFPESSFQCLQTPAMLKRFAVKNATV